MPAIRKTRAKRYQLDFTLFGHRIRTNFFEEAHAADFKERLLASLPVRYSTLEQAINTYLTNETDKRKSDQSRISERLWFYELKAFLKEHCGIKPDDFIVEITRFHLEKFQAHLKKVGSARGRPLKASSVNRRFHSIKNLFRKLHDWGFVKNNPSVSIRKLPEKLSRRARWNLEELQLVIELPALSKLDRDIMLFLLNTGIRLGSALDTRECDVDLVNKTIMVRQKKGSTGEETYYVIPIAPSIEDLVRERIYGKPKDFLFKDPSHGGKVSLHMISKRFSRIFEKLGRPHLTLHGLRHTFGSKLHDAGASMETIRRLLGHKSVVTTQRYLHGEVEHLRQWLE